MLWLIISCTRTTGVQSYWRKMVRCLVASVPSTLPFAIYFFVTDRIRAGEISPKWCPTGEMIADFLTKPLQGAMFWKFRDLLMGVVPTENTNALLAQ